MTRRRIAILGAGPVGLEAALAASRAGMPFTVFEAAEDIADNVRSWGHVRLFTPWEMNVSPGMRACLEARGMPVPSGGECPTGHELVARLLRPVAEAPEVAPHIRLGTRVREVSREGLLKNAEIGTPARAEPPFRLVLSDSDGTERVEHAEIVLDCTGTYGNPNALGSGGIRAPGERALEDRITRLIPDVLGDEATWADRSILLVGGGHSGQTVARDLAELVRRHPGTRVLWVLRGSDSSFGAIPADPLPARVALLESAAEIASGATGVEVRMGRGVEALKRSGSQVAVMLRDAEGSFEEIVVDHIIALTGSVGDATLYRQLQIHECWATSGPMKLAAALLGSGSADCLTQASHGPETLENPEPDFFLVGSKSYGRNNTFLLRVGWEQVAEVFELITTSGDVS